MSFCFQCLYPFREGFNIIAEKENLIYKTSIKLIRNDEIRFTVDDLARIIHISKKTLYKRFPSKLVLANWIYDKACYFFTIALKKVKGAPSLTKENLYILLDSYSDILLLDEEKTLNRYSISSELNNKIFEEFSVQKNAFLSYLKTTHLGKYVDNTAFILSINSTICSILEKENIEELLSNFCENLMVI